MKVVIVGGGIAGLSAATILCNMPHIDIVIYEKENNIGGQAASMPTNACNVEYSWRIYGGMYYNLMNIFFSKLKINEQFEKLENNCFIDDKKIADAYLGFTNQIYAMLSYMKLSEYHKLFELFMICKERIYKDYDINAYEYFNKNPIVQTILGPFLGLDANKVSLAGAIKNLYSTTDTKVYDFNKEAESLLTKNPTSSSIFNYWEKYLKEKGVKIFTNSEIESVTISSNRIESLLIKSNNKHQHVKSDDYIFACSLDAVIKLFEYKYNCATLDKMKHLRSGLQLYFTINMYFSKKISNVECKQNIIVDMPWKPIIQRKLSWSKDIINRCEYKGRKIEEVWNVGFLDYNKGRYNNKILSECSIEEAIEEGVKQVKENTYIQNIILAMGESFDSIYIGSEYWYQFKNNSNGKLVSENPKFSINVGTMKNMPESFNSDTPTNMYLAGYYVNSSVGGVSMESSCETGLTAGKCIIDKYGYDYDDILPIKHDREIFTDITLPLVFLDKILFYYNLPSLTKYADAFYVFIVYIIIAFIVIFFILYGTIDTLLSKNIIHAIYKLYKRGSLLFHRYIVKTFI